MYDATASVTGVPFFEALAKSLAEAIGVSFGFVGQLDPDDPRLVRSFAYWKDGAFEPAITYAIEGTPCVEAIARGACAYGEGVHARFPGDRVLVALQIESYVGVRITGPSGEPLGVMVAFDRRPIELVPELEPLLSTFAIRAAAEILRQRNEAALRRDAALAEQLARIAQHLNDHITDLAVMSAGLCELVVEALEVDACQVVGLDASGEALRLCGHHGLHPVMLAGFPMVERALTERMWPEVGAVMVIEAPGDKPTFPSADAYRRADVRLLAASACWQQGRIIGVVSTHVYGRPRRLVTSELNFIRAVSGQVASAMAVHTLHERLRSSENQYRQIVTTCLEGVWMIDAHGSTTFANAQLAAMLGYSAEAMTGRSMFDFMDEVARAEATRNMERRKQGISERHEFRWTHKDGRDVFTLMATNPLVDERGAFVGAVALLTDITERRGLELKVQQAQKLESLGVLAGGIAHDFNNLLVGILGNVGLAQMDLATDHAAAPALHDIQIAAIRAADLTKQMLAYSGKGRFVVQRLNLNRLLEESTPLLAAAISKGATLRLELAPTLPDVEADASQLGQVVMNLITNASDSLGDGSGSIRVSTGALFADKSYLASTYLDDALREGDYVFMEVSDSGIGMSADTQSKIFDPFYTTKFPGRGLGLAAVLGILRGHRGAIKVYSEVGKGSTFKVLLPCREQTSAALDVGPPPGAPVTPRSAAIILVADDEPAVRHVARRVLEKLGFQVITADDGRAAIDLFNRNQAAVSAVLLDMTMPGPSGEDVFRELRRVKPDVRVVLTSGYNEQEATSRFVGTGLAGFLQKPWRPSDLEAAMSRAIGELDPRGRP